MTSKQWIQNTRAGHATQELTQAAGGKSTTLGRRTFLRGALVGGAGMLIGTQTSGCAEAESRSGNNEPTNTPVRTTTPLLAAQPTAAQPTVATTAPATQPISTATASGSKILLVYFSRPGENYAYGGRTTLTIGNTDVVAGMIRERIACDVYRIEPAEPYADSYDATVARNVQEQNANACPAIANPLATIDSYDTVLLGSPIWNVRAPMIMTTFVEGFDFTGKTVIPFVTYAVSGLGTAVRDYTASCTGATIGEGLAVRGEEVQKAGVAVEAWLRRINLLR